MINDGDTQIRHCLTYCIITRTLPKSFIIVIQRSDSVYDIFLQYYQDITKNINNGDTEIRHGLKYYTTRILPELFIMVTRDQTWLNILYNQNINRIIRILPELLIMVIQRSENVEHIILPSRKYRRS